MSSLVCPGSSFVAKVKLVEYRFITAAAASLHIASYRRKKRSEDIAYIRNKVAPGHKNAETAAALTYAQVCIF